MGSLDCWPEESVMKILYIPAEVRSEKAKVVMRTPILQGQWRLCRGPGISLHLHDEVESPNLPAPLGVHHRMPREESGLSQLPHPIHGIFSGSSNRELLPLPCSGASVGAYRSQSLLTSPFLLPNNNEKPSLSAVKEGWVRNLDF